MAVNFIVPLYLIVAIFQQADHTVKIFVLKRYMHAIFNWLGMLFILLLH